MSFKFLKKLAQSVLKLDYEINDYKRVVKNPALPSIAYVNWALHLADTGSFVEAEDKLLSSTMMAHQTPEAYISLGMLKVKERKFDEAINYYVKAIRLDENNAKAFCFLGNALTEISKFDEAEKKFKHSLKLAPNNSDVLMNWGISLVRQKKYLMAKDKFELAYRINAANYPAIYFLGLIDLELGDFTRAKEKFTNVCKSVPSHFEALYYLAYVYFKEENYAKSLENAVLSLKVFNKKIETHMLLAESFMHLNDEVNCLKVYQDAIKECTPTFYFLISWGMSLQKFKKYDESIEIFKKAIEIFPENDLGYSNLGLSFYNLNDYTQAGEFFQKSLQLNPNNPIVLESLGQMEFDKENYSNAIKYFLQVLKINARAVHNYARVANAYFLNGDNQRANEFYKKAIEYQPDRVEIYVDFAKILIEQKDYKNAQKRLEKAHRLNCLDKDCMNNLFYVNYLLAKENISDYNVKGAIELANKIEKLYPDSFVYREEKQELETHLSKNKVD